MDYQTVTRVYQKIRLALYHITELEGTKLSGEIEMDESYFGEADAKESEGEEQAVKALYLAFWSAMDGFTHELWKVSQPRIS